MFRNLSYTVKIPLAFTLVIVLTEIIVTAALMSRAFADARRDLEASAANLNAVLARSLRDPMMRDDMWSAFEVIRTPVSVKDEANTLQNVVVLDTVGRVFVASDPKRFPATTPATGLPAEYRVSLSRLSESRHFFFGFAPGKKSEDVVSAGQIVADDGTPLGHVLLSFDANRFDERVKGTLLQLAFVSVLGLTLLIPLAWLWGKRMARPLGQLADAMQRVGKDSPIKLAEELPRSTRDEIGVLTSSFETMLAELDRKASLEREVVSAERLAAVGRVATGIAHEINNPLGGMLNAVDTLAKHGNPDAFTGKTLGLLARGLNQIRTTVGALLVEARLDSPAMHPADWEDLRTLVEPQMLSRGTTFEWNDRVDQPLALPAHQVRQLVLNLLLNASKAAGSGGTVGLDASAASDVLKVVVWNSGATIPPAVMAHLFEPFVNSSVKDGKRSYGIGLWVCYQVVANLGGTIAVESADGLTRFLVSIPMSLRETSTCTMQNEFA